MSIINMQSSLVAHLDQGSPNPGQKDLGALMSVAAAKQTGPLAQAAQASHASKQPPEQSLYGAPEEKALAEAQETVKRARATAEWAKERADSSSDPQAVAAADAADLALGAAVKAEAEAKKVVDLANNTETSASNFKEAKEVASAAMKEAKSLMKIAGDKLDNTNFINRLFNKFAQAKVASTKDGSLQSFNDHLNEQIDALGTGDSSDPKKLALYQKAIMMFTVHTNATSSMVKSIADLDKGVVRDFN